jgi:thiol-disulfide isomerase/thioredoxin
LVGIAVLAVIGVIALSWWSAANPPVQETLPVSVEEGKVATSPDQIRYQDYSPAAFASTQGKKRVLFFYAAWCPTCRPADAEFSASADEIPEDVVLFRVNYDTETELKARYKITYQHTYVWVDDEGIEISKWNGGALAELIAKTQK